MKFMNSLANCDNCIVSKISIFDVLTAKEREMLYKNHSCASFRKGEIIYKEGEKPMGLISLSEGKAKIFKEGVGGRDQIIRMANPVSFIGYRALFAGDYYTSSAVALEDCVICIIDKDSLFSVLENNSKLAMNIIRFIARELGFSNMRTVTLTQKHIRGRLAESLLSLLDTYGTEEDNITIKVYLSREDVANLSNMTTSNAIRTLSAFAAENVISISGRKIKILDIKKLQKISELG